MVYRKSSPRLPGYDYSLAAYYFVTICTLRRQLRFGEVLGDLMVPNRIGNVIQLTWTDLPKHYPHVTLDGFIIMPNHIHAIVILNDDCRDRFRNLSLQDKRRHGLSEVVRGFKTWSARRVNEYEGTPGFRLWQRSFYDHIIREEEGLMNIRAYIRNNPANWSLDSENPETVK